MTKSVNRRELLKALQREKNISADPVAIKRRPVAELEPVSSQQERLWFLQQLTPTSTAYNMCATLELEGRIDSSRLQDALQRLVDRHEPLHRTLEVVDNSLQARRRNAVIPFENIDARKHADAKERAHVAGQLDAETPFVLDRDIPIRAQLWWIADTSWQLHLTAHHVAADGWAVGLLLQELAALYRNDNLPPLLARYSDYAAEQSDWLHDETAVAPDKAFWRQHLQDLPGPAPLPYDFGQPSAPKYTGRQLRLRLPASTQRLIQSLAAQLKTTTFGIWAAALAAMLGRESACDDITIGMPAANREGHVEQSLVGMFANTLPIRTHVDEHASLSQLALSFASQISTALEHQRLPYDQIIDTVASKGRRSDELVSVMLSSAEQVRPSFDLGSATATIRERHNRGAKFPLVFTIGALDISLDYDTERFRNETAQHLLKTYAATIEELLASPGAACEKPPLPLPENHARPSRTEPTVLQQVAFQKGRRGDSIAVRSGTTELTYDAVWRAATALAARLEREGVRRGSAVVISSRRSPEFIVGVLASWLCGAHYVPLELGTDRSSRIHRQVAPAITLVFPDEHVPYERTITLNDTVFEERSTVERAPTVAGEEIAYQLFTSGSTGAPKGVEIPHRALANHMNWLINQFAHDEQTCVLQKTALTFDCSVMEMLLPLLVGGTLIIAPQGTEREPRQLARLLHENSTTDFFATPTALQALLEASDDIDWHVKRLYPGGEALTAGLAHRLRSHASSVVNLYGPTEVCIDATFHIVTSTDDAVTIPIGTPIDGIDAYVLNDQLRPVGCGYRGELFLAGAGLANGYRGLPAETAQRFLPNPFDQVPGSRMYRTGDLVRRRPDDGAIEFLGRNDDQVKLRGFRIELGEVEHALEQLSPVRKACAAIRNGDTLVAFVQVAPQGSAAHLRDELRSRVPGYLVPDHLEVVDIIPVTPSGKADRASLLSRPLLDESNVRAEPRGAVDQAETPAKAELIARLCSQVLGVESVGVDEDFFEIGGHSLTAARLAARIRRDMSHEAPVRLILEARTPRQIWERLARNEHSTETPVITRAADATDYRLSPGQMRIWFLQSLDPTSGAFVMPAAVRAEGEFREETFRQALAQLVGHHESLRTVFTASSEPRQRILTHIDPHYVALDLRDLEPSVQQQRLAELKQENESRPFDLIHGPLLRCTSARTNNNETVILLAMHHIISDGTSVAIFVRDLLASYSALLRGKPISLSPNAVRYVDFAKWQATQALALRQRAAHFAQTIQGVPPLSLPVDGERTGSFAAARCSFALSTDMSAAIGRLAARHHLTDFMVLAGTLGCLFARWTGRDDFLIGCPLAGRTDTSLENIVGFFVNVLPLRIELPRDCSMSSLAPGLKANVGQLLSNQDLSFEAVLDELEASSRDINRSPLFDVCFNLMPEVLRLETPDLRIQVLDVEAAAAKFDLNIYAWRDDEKLAFNFVYNSSLFSKRRIQALTDQFRILLSALVDGDDVDLRTVPLRESAPDVRPARMMDLTLAQAFERTTERYSDATACSDSSRSLSFSQLRQCVDIVTGVLATDAHERHLCPLNAVLWGEKSHHLLAAVLGAWSAGWSVTMLDPALPQRRREALLASVPCDAVLSLGADEAIALATQLAVPHHDLEALLAKRKHVHPSPVPTPSPAYYLFTSGTTGGPKCIASGLDPLVAFLNWHVTEHNIGPRDRVAALSGVAHDPIWRDLLTGVISGAACVFPPSNVLESPQALRQWLQSERISVLHCTPPLAQLVVTSASTGQLPELRVVCIGGDILTWRLVDDLRRVAPAARVVNFYGATETPQAVAYFPATSYDGQKRATVPIGRGTTATVDVRSPFGEPAAEGELGEVVVISPFLSLGYVAQKAGAPLTTDHLEPYGNLAGVRQYRTGDLGRLGEDGIEFVGRRDHQVKLSGYRVEIEEVEDIASARLGVPVIAIPTPSEHPTHLIAAVPPGKRRDGLDWQSQLARDLPAYMLPRDVIELAQWPLTPSGKTDRKRAAELAQQVLLADQSKPRESLASDTEKRLARLWCKMLRVDQVGRHDSFFALGGQSLQALSLIGEINREFGTNLGIRRLMETPTLTELASLIDAGADHGPRLAKLTSTLIQPEGDEDEFPLTEVQRAYWVGRHKDFELGGVSTHTYVEIDMRSFDIDRFEIALNELIRRHGALRTIFTEDGQQRTLPSVVEFHIQRVDTTTWDERDRSDMLSQIRGEMEHQVLDASRWPVFDVRATMLEAGIVRLHLSLDALLFDAHSRQILVAEVSELYQSERAALRPLALTFRQYVEALERVRETSVYKKAWAYWEARLSSLPTAPQLPLRDTAKASEAVFVPRTFTLCAEDWRRLQRLAGERGMSSTSTVLALYAETIARWSKSTRFLLNLTLFNREQIHPDVNHLVGDFTTLELLEVDHDFERPFHARASALQRRLWEDLENATVSGLEVIRELRKRAATSKALAPVVFTSTLGLAGDAQLPFGYHINYANSQTPQVWLDCIASESAVGGLDIRWNCIDSLFYEGVPGAMFSAFKAAVTALARSAEPWTSTSVVGLPHDQVARRQQMNATSAPYRRELLHVATAADIAERASASIVSPDEVVGADEIDQWANAIGQELEQRGCRASERIIVALKKGPRQVASVLGILRAGGVYVPVLPTTPAHRLQFIAEATDARFVLVDDETDIASFGALSPLVVGSPRRSDWRPSGKVSPADTAYIIFTSGSTGTPKGVAIAHEAALNTVDDINRRFSVTSKDVVFAISSLSFDLSVYDIFGLLAAGGTLVYPSEEQAGDVAHWAELLIAHGVTIWNSVPALVGLLVDYWEQHPSLVPTSLRLIMMSGDWIPTSLVPRLQRLAPNAKLVSLGGATEASIWSIAYEIDEFDADWRSVPYGTPLTNQTFHVLSADMLDQPDYVVGELYIGGVGVAQCYWGDEQKTAASFRTHPRNGERLYRTGDLGRYLKDGTIEFLGREDTQVKVQGFRIELGEIDAALASSPGVGLAAAVAVGPRDGDRRLVAFVTPKEQELAIDQVQRHLREALLDYMVPKDLRVVDAMPLTANGKVDRGRLAALAEDAGSTASESVSGQDSDLVIRMLEIVRASLGIPTLSATDNILERGADSIRLIRAVNDIEREFGARPRLADLYRVPTVEGVARLVQPTARQPSSAEAAGPASSTMLVDPEERARYKRERINEIEAGTAGGVAVAAAVPATIADLWSRRRSVREYSAEPVPRVAFDQMLSVLQLRKHEPAEQGRFGYPSAGGLYGVYPVIYVRPGRVESVESGAYMYMAATNSLLALSTTAALPRIAFSPLLNGPIFDNAALFVFLCGDLNVYRPLYGDQSRHFATLEAGIISTWLDVSATAAGLASCHLGGVDQTEIQRSTGLLSDALLLHTVAVGMTPNPGREAEPDDLKEDDEVWEL